MRILITGARGFVGSKLMAHYPEAIAAPSLRNISEEALHAFLAEAQPEVIIHTAAVSDMGQCEANPEESYQANVVLPDWLAKHNPGAKLVLFSSDQVYNGSPEPGPYTEDMACPANRYARQKLEMENRVLERNPDAVLLRAEWMYDWIAPKGNFIRNILNPDIQFRAGSRQFRGITYTREVCEAMDAVIRLPGGAYNFGSETDISFYEIAREFLAYVGRDVPVADMPPVHNLWMDCSKARQYGVHFSTALEGVKRCARDNGLV